MLLLGVSLLNTHDPCIFNEAFWLGDYNCEMRKTPLFAAAAAESQASAINFFKQHHESRVIFVAEKSCKFTQLLQSARLEKVVCQFGSLSLFICGSGFFLKFCFSSSSFFQRTFTKKSWTTDAKSAQNLDFRNKNCSRVLRFSGGPKLSRPPKGAAKTWLKHH